MNFQVTGMFEWVQKSIPKKFPCQISESYYQWLLNRCNLMRQMLKQPQNNEVGKFGHYHES